MAQNLGQVSAVHVGDTAPANKKLIWVKLDSQTEALIGFFVYDEDQTIWTNLDVRDIALTRIAEISPIISSPTYTIQAGDLGKVLLFTNNTGCTVTIPTGLIQGFQCSGFYHGTGILDFVPENGVTLQGKNNGTTLQEQFDPFYILHLGGDVVNLSGDLV